MSSETSETPKKGKRGFGSMSPEKIRAIASLGGKAAHANGTGHKFTHDEAVAAGRKGGVAPHRSRGPAPAVWTPTEAESST